MKAAIKMALYRAVCRRFGFRIVSYDFASVHYAMSFREALEWVACYPVEDYVAIYYGASWTVVASREGEDVIFKPA